MASPAPLEGGRRGGLGGLREPEGGRIGVDKDEGGRDDLLLRVSKILTVSLTRDLRLEAEDLVGEEASSLSSVEGRVPSWPLIIRLDLTGLGLEPNLASNLLGKDMGLGIRDLLPLRLVKGLELEPGEVMVLELVASLYRGEWSSMMQLVRQLAH